MSKPELIYANDFFNISHPLNPYVEIQFKTNSANKEKGLEDVWESVTLLNNYFDNLTITDESGFQNLELKLKDRDYINLEDIILRTIAYSRIQSWKNFFTEENKKKYSSQTSILNSYFDREYSVQEQAIIRKEISDLILDSQFQVYISTEDAACIRIRFGYSAMSSNYYEVIDKKDFGGRMEYKKPTIRTPWIYFMLLGVNYNVDNDGNMAFLIKGISVSKAYLETARLLVNGIKMTGKPEEIWNKIAEKILKGSNNQILLVSKSKDLPTSTINNRYEPDENFFEYQKKEITLSTLYEEIRKYLDQNGQEVRKVNFKTVRQLLSDFVNLLSPKYIDLAGKPIKPNDKGEISEDDLINVHHICKPDFYVDEFYNGIGEVEKIGVHLYYRDPKPEDQKYLRVYSWKDTPNSVIKNFSISSECDFAQMNAPITIKDKDGNFHQLSLQSVSVGRSGVLDSQINLVADLTKELENSRGQNGLLSAGVYLSSNYDGKNSFMESFIQNVNDNVFKGTLELFLDPFYLFDDRLKPYQYMINIDVNTPSRYTQSGVYVSGGTSYLSGNYLIGKITHSISAGSATTALEVIKFPYYKDVAPPIERKIDGIDYTNQIKALEEERIKLAKTEADVDKYQKQKDQAAQDIIRWDADAKAAHEAKDYKAEQTYKNYWELAKTDWREATQNLNKTEELLREIQAKCEAIEASARE